MSLEQLGAYIDGWNGENKEASGEGYTIEEIRMFNIAAGIERKQIKKK